VGGNAKVSTAQSKFGGASALFDGTSDYLSVPGFSDLAFGTGNFTLEAWVRQSARSDAMTIFDTRNSGNTSGGFVLYMRADNYMEIYWNTALVSSANPLPTVNTWYHVAMSKSGNDLKVFVDGTAVMSYTLNSGFSQTAAGPFIIGQDFQLTGTPGNSWNGYIDEVRFSNIARYTANFTAPTAAFTNDRDTLLLLHCEGANNSTTFTDDNFIRPTSLVAINGAALDTSQSKFGGSSLLCSSSTNPQIIFDNLVCNAVGTNPFTVELFFRTTNLTQSNKVLFFTNQGGAGRRGIQITNQTVRYTVDGADVITTGNYLTSGTWHHIALVRGTNNTTNLYIDGTSRGSYASDTSSFAATNQSRIAGLANGFTPDGHMDELRISKTARYTATFTPTTAAFVNDANTTLLVHFDGTNGSTTFTDDNA
jgi:hypothetical protein